MRLIRLLPPFFIGFALLYIVLIQLRGFMAARQVPTEYFRFFGKEHQELALFIFWLVYYQAVAQAQVHGEPNLNWQELVAQLQAPWWAAPALLSPAVGVGLGVWLATRGNHAAALTEA